MDNEVRQTENQEPQAPIASADEEFEFLSAAQVSWRAFAENRVALVSALILIILYILVIFAEFFAPYDMRTAHTEFIYAQPQRIRFYDREKRTFHVRPFVYGLQGERDPRTMRRIYTDNTGEKHFLKLFVRKEPYKLLGLFETDLHFFGVEEGTAFLMGTDRRGRDMLSRTLHGGRISLTICLLSVAITVILGALIGTVSGYYGGWVDTATQRSIEVIRSFPRLALWMALAAAIPAKWPSVWVFFGIMVVLGFIGWTGLARELRGKVLSLRNADFVHAAEVMGAGTPRILFIHLIPNLASHIVVTGTIRIPMMIMAESSLSFLGLGIKAPMTSWGRLLSDANQIQILRLYPWMLIPGAFLVLSVLCFNFAGDALRDVVDPYSS